MHLINADLHCHSQVSDGTLSPEALAERAFAQGVELWSLTDHDEVGGQQRARDAALALGMDYLTGTEISVSFIGETVHIVGLGFDAENEALRAGLAATRSGRRERARQMAAGQPVDNFLRPDELSNFERGQLKDAFGVVKSLQDVLAHRYQGGRF